MAYTEKWEELEAERVEFEESYFMLLLVVMIKKERLDGLGSFAKAVPNRNGKTDVCYIPEKMIK